MDRDLRIRVILSKVGDLIGPLKGIGTQAKATSAGLRDTQTRLKALQATTGNVAGFRALKGQLRGTETEMGAAQTRVDALARAFNATSTPTKKLTADFANAKKYAAALKTQHGDQSAQLQTLRDKLSAAGVSTKDLAAHERTLRGDLSRTTEELAAQKKALADIAAADRRRAGAQRQLDRTRQRASNLAIGGAATIGTGLAILAPLQQAIGAASTYQGVMTGIAQKTGLSRVEATRLGAVLASLAPKVNQLPSNLAAGADVLAGFGLTAKAIPALMLPIGKAATAYEADIADLAKASFAVADNLKVPFDQSAKAIDIMAEAGKRGAFEMKDMAQYFPALTAASQGLGQKGAPAVADLAAALQIVRKGAGDSGTAANNLQNLLAKITAPGTTKKFAALGVDLPKALNKAYAEGKTPVEAISELVNKTLAGDMSKLGTLFEDMQVQQALRPLIANLGEYRQIRSDALAATGTVEADFTERLLDSGQASQRLETATQALQIKLGTVLLPTLVILTEKFNVVLDKVIAWTDANPGLTKAIAVIAAVLGIALVVFGGLAVAIAGILGPFALLRFALVALAPAAWAAVLPFLPFIAIALGIGLAALAIYNHWDSIVAFFAAIWGGLVAGWNQFKARVALWPQSFKDAGMAIMDGLRSGISEKWQALKTYVGGIGTSIANVFKNALGIRSPSRVFASFGDNLMRGLANGISGGVSAPLARVQDASRAITAALAIGAAAASPVAAAGAGKAGGNAPVAVATPAASYTFHITQQPGESGDALAKRIAAELDKRERAKAARARSSLSDYGE